MDPLPCIPLDTALPLYGTLLVRESIPVGPLIQLPPQRSPSSMTSFKTEIKLPLADTRYYLDFYTCLQDYP